MHGTINDEKSRCLCVEQSCLSARINRHLRAQIATSGRSEAIGRIKGAARFCRPPPAEGGGIRGGGSLAVLPKKKPPPLSPSREGTAPRRRVGLAVWIAYAPHVISRLAPHLGVHHERAGVHRPSGSIPERFEISSAEELVIGCTNRLDCVRSTAELAENSSSIFVLGGALPKTGSRLGMHAQRTGTLGLQKRTRTVSPRLRTLHEAVRLT